MGMSGPPLTLFSSRQRPWLFCISYSTITNYFFFSVVFTSLTITPQSLSTVKIEFCPHSQLLINVFQLFLGMACFVIRKVLFTLLLFLCYIEAKAIYFCKQDILLYFYIKKSHSNALSREKQQKITPLRQYDVTGWNYVKDFISIVISAPKNPMLASDCSSLFYIPRIWYQTIVTKSPWDTYKNMMKNLSPLNLFIFAQYTYPIPPKTMLFRLWDTSHCCAREIFPLPHVLLTKNNIVWGEEGEESLVQSKKVQSIPGLLATIVDLNPLFID